MNAPKAEGRIKMRGGSRPRRDANTNERVALADNLAR